MKTYFSTRQTKASDVKESGATINSKQPVVINQNLTVFGESVQQITGKHVKDVPQSAQKEMNRVDQWINEWKQGMLRIDAGLY